MLLIPRKPQISFGPSSQTNKKLEHYISISEINHFGWIFVVSLAIFMIGVLGWCISRRMLELVARLDRSGETPNYSYFQEWLLPKYRAGLGRFANEEFHETVNQRAQNRPARVALALLVLGTVIQICLWVYLFNFAEGPISFLNGKT